jgi:hypothetical protein
MYLKKNGIEIQTLALAGGGMSSACMYMGLLRDIDLNALTFDLVLCSAGALWFGEALCRKLETNDESVERENRVRNVHQDLLNVDIVSILESENEAIVGQNDIDRLRQIYSCIHSIRVKDLKNICNGRLIRFAVSSINHDTMLHEPIIVDETNSGDTFLFDVVMASCSLPLVFPAVSLTVNGQAKQCVDGDMSDYPKLLVDDNYVVVKSKVWSLIHLYDTFKTNIPFVDNMLKYFTSTILQGLVKTWTGHEVLHECVASLDTQIGDQYFYNKGIQIFEENFTFQKPTN